MTFQFNDGGRSEAGFKGTTGDCVTRAIAIATGKPYQEVYYALNALAVNERIGKRKKKISHSKQESTVPHRQSTLLLLDGNG